jgi:hypothetical protein
MKTAIFYLAATVIAASCLTAAPASATIIAALTRNAPTEATDHAKTLLPLNDAGDTSFTYGAEIGQTEVYTFNAECVADGPAGSYVTINITVDNHLTEPSTAKESAFCSPGGSPVSASRVATFTFTGHHPRTIRVYATGVGTASWHLKSSLLLIED